MLSNTIKADVHFIIEMKWIIEFTIQLSAHMSGLLESCYVGIQMLDDSVLSEQVIEQITTLLEPCSYKTQFENSLFCNAVSYQFKIDIMFMLAFDACIASFTN